MAYLELENEVNSALRMDHAIPHGPLMHSQRCEQTSSNSATNISLNTSSSAGKTPCKAVSKEYTSAVKTPSSRTPSSTGDEF